MLLRASCGFDSRWGVPKILARWRGFLLLHYSLFCLSLIFCLREKISWSPSEILSQRFPWSGRAALYFLPPAGRLHRPPGAVAPLHPQGVPAQEVPKSLILQGFSALLLFHFAALFVYFFKDLSSESFLWNCYTFKLSQEGDCKAVFAQKSEIAKILPNL